MLGVILQFNSMENVICKYQWTDGDAVRVIWLKQQCSMQRADCTIRIRSRTLNHLRCFDRFERIKFQHNFYSRIYLSTYWLGTPLSSGLAYFYECLFSKICLKLSFPHIYNLVTFGISVCIANIPQLLPYAYLPPMGNARQKRTFILCLR